MHGTALYASGDGNRSRLLGVWVIPLCVWQPLTGFPLLQACRGPWGRYMMMGGGGCAQPCSSSPVHVCTTQPTAPRDSDMDVNDPGEPKRKAQGRVSGKEFVSALGNKEWKFSSPVSASTGTGFFLIPDTSLLRNVLSVAHNPDAYPEAHHGGHHCLQGHQAAAVCPGLHLLPDAFTQLPDTSTAVDTWAPTHRSTASLPAQHQPELTPYS